MPGVWCAFTLLTLPLLSLVAAAHGLISDCKFVLGGLVVLFVARLLS